MQNLCRIYCEIISFVYGFCLWICKYNKKKHTSNKAVFFYFFDRPTIDILEHCLFVCAYQAEKHHPALVQLLCNELKVKPDVLLDFELCLADTQPAVSPLRKIWQHCFASLIKSEGIRATFAAAQRLSGLSGEDEVDCCRGFICTTLSDPVSLHSSV